MWRAGRGALSCARQIFFKTRIYHPNVVDDEGKDQGKICLPLCTTENWKPAVKVQQGLRTMPRRCAHVPPVIESLLQLVNEPEPSHPVNQEAGELFVKDRTKFDKVLSRLPAAVWSPRCRRRTTTARSTR